MAKKKNKQVLRPWCWYCEREFEDEKVLMQHQKAKHFKCSMCPRRLNTAGGLAVHIQQVHKLEADNLPRIENALPGRDGYEVEIFGMEGIPAPDVADYKRRKEIELGLAAGSISQPQPKRPKVENRLLSEEELRAQLEAHKALMGGSSDVPSAPAPEATATVYNALPTAYATPPVPQPGVPPSGVSPPGPPPMLGMPPFSLPPGFLPGPFPPGFPMPPPGTMPPLGAMPPGMLPPGPPFLGGVPRSNLPPPTFVPAGSSLPFPPVSAIGTPSQAASEFAMSAPTLDQSVPPTIRGVSSVPPPLVLPNAALEQKYGPFKKKTELKYSNPNFSPEEKRAHSTKYYFTADGPGASTTSDPLTIAANIEDTRGKKRARAEDFL